MILAIFREDIKLFFIKMKSSSKIIQVILMCLFYFVPSLVSSIQQQLVALVTRGLLLSCIMFHQVKLHAQ